MKKILFPIVMIMVCLILSGWGWRGHIKISRNAMYGLPAGMQFMQPSWTAFVENHASDADYRKDNDPDESPRHYIDLDNYTEFNHYGFISHSYDSVIAQHGLNFVIKQGILPWATIRTYDSLKECFRRGDWNRSALFAADLGHYVGDGHMPLHLTRNYDGQYSGQTGIHSRYETRMISRFDGQIQYVIDSALYISDVTSFVFSYIYTNYPYVDSLLSADSAAFLATGSISSNAYYQALWDRTGPFTVRLLKDASIALVSLVYTAWFEAGSPMMYPNSIPEPEQPGQPLLLQPYPNPASDYVILPLVAPPGMETMKISIFNPGGVLVDTISAPLPEEGINRIRFTTAHLEQGVYVCRLQTGTMTATRKFIVSR